MTEELKQLREALRRVKHEAASLADAQVIALEALTQRPAAQGVEREADDCDVTGQHGPLPETGWDEAPPEAFRKPSPTAGMNLGQRIKHVGGRENAAGYIEFGSVAAVRALVRQYLRDLPTQPAAQATPEPVRPDIIERLTYHQLERDDLSLDDCLAYLASGWKKVHGRTERQMVMQLLALLAGQPATPEPEWETSPKDGEQWEATPKAATPEPVGEPDTVPLDALHAAERERDYWKTRARAMLDHAEGTCWYWMGDGEDHLESLVNSLPVVIRADQLRELLARPAPGVPEGFVLVPVEPTQAMLDALHSSAYLPGCYRAMLAAAQAKGQ